MAFKIYKNDSEDFNFVLGCLYSQAIDLAEFRIWIERIIETTPVEDIPFYIFDLVDFDGYLYEISKIIGFVPDDCLSNDEKNSLYGIAFLRGADIYDPPVTRDEALKAVERNPNILERFKSLFPFINLD
ncbi:hypothetical protein [Acinetobacter nosocomialis]|uniref:hypothetical protein n=1 Tax=Acinetobacter nosocomialis TaxID=106654 RepID=UPI00124FFA17|nr:hypothetical protein [Acinetobacter nosocomialis]MBP1483044.1 hypothetical protein [Acinetobacter nosocomialis]